ncbi:MAG: hypothetical protein V4757_07305 [Pseudomonadota bacterium]
MPFLQTLIAAFLALLILLAGIYMGAYAERMYGQPEVRQTGQGCVADMQPIRGFHGAPSDKALTRPTPPLRG